MRCIMGHSLMENLSGLIVQADLTRADGRAEWRAANDMLHRPSPGPIRDLTLAADRGCSACRRAKGAAVRDTALVGF